MIPYEPGEPLTCQQLRELDILAIEHLGMPGLILMENAARGAAEYLYQRFIHPRREPVVLLCGGGNNGGDGFVVARHLRNAGVPVTVVIGVPRGAVRGDAAVHLGIVERLEMPLVDATVRDGLSAALDELRRARWIVDALLGTGAHGALRSPMSELIEASNALPNARRVAIDVPTGLSADEGISGPVCFRADVTLTFVAAKIGFSNPAAAEVLGRVEVLPIGVPLELIPGRRGRESQNG